ncbi:probable 2-oxoglutarate-dependent dioxygenase AOP1 [Pistacia vera]|uniref:probable 2-oxoglutarate-dependent dioxygenase AOP1 n=1 Tax=Pistacia vera TaxID=55513 RepID=UPI0012633C11|nr:probable 2-oxoglutarate-dependent dioxygenase AOP1 [Pistacia vera]
MDSPKLPVIDLSRAELRPGTESWISTSKQVCHALEEYGCFVIKCNKVSLDLHSAIYSAIQDLFNLPTEIKQLIQATSEQPARDVLSTNPNHERIDMDDLTSLEATHNFSNLLWPAGNDHFCQSVNEISKIMMNIDQTVVKMVFQNYGVDKYYDSHVGSTRYVTAGAKYKQLDKNNENYLGIVTHTDKTFSTILHQKDVNGLEIQTKDGQWILYQPPSHSSFIYFAADAFKAWSNGRIHACWHRVMMSGNKTRFSLGLFMFHKGVLQVPDELIDEEHPLRYKPFNHLEYRESVREHAVNGIYHTIEAHCGV